MLAARLSVGMRLGALSLFSFWISSSAFAADDATPPLEPITVEADSMVIELDRERAIWRGNVTARQGGYRFSSGQLTLLFEHIARKSDVKNARRNTTSELIHGYELSADQVTYDLANQEIRAVGNSELRRGAEVIRADRIIYAVADKRAYAQPRANGRVQAQFYGRPGVGLFTATPLISAAGR